MDNNRRPRSESHGIPVMTDIESLCVQYLQMCKTVRRLEIDKLQTNARAYWSRSMAAKNKGLEWKHQCLQPQNQGMHEPQSVHNMKNDSRMAPVSGAAIAS